MGAKTIHKLDNLMGHGLVVGQIDQVPDNGGKERDVEERRAIRMTTKP